MFCVWLKCFICDCEGKEFKWMKFYICIFLDKNDFYLKFNWMCDYFLIKLNIILMMIGVIVFVVVVFIILLLNLFIYWLIKCFKLINYYGIFCV